MNIIDYAKEFNQPKVINKHNPIFPTNIFCVVSGSTGSGKTNLVLNLLMKESLLNYSHVYVYSSTLHQAAYVHLKNY